jgi:histidyl-tRNA synthetase
VRGLDYYTKTVFEFVSGQIGAQGTVCGGGRYDGLVEELGGQPTPALGFGMGIERLLLVLDAAKAEMPDPVCCDIYFANMGEAAALKAFQLCGQLRQEGFYAECDLMGRSLKAQMKYANKIGARYSMVLGDSEIESGKANLKNMATGEQVEMEIGEGFAGRVYDLMANAAYNEL